MRNQKNNYNLKCANFNWLQLPSYECSCNGCPRCFHFKVRFYICRPARKIISHGTTINSFAERGALPQWVTLSNYLASAKWVLGLSHGLNTYESGVRRSSVLSPWGSARNDSSARSWHKEIMRNALEISSHVELHHRPVHIVQFLQPIPITRERLKTVPQSPIMFGSTRSW